MLIELRCSVDLDSKSGGATSNRKVKGTIHWVSARARDRCGSSALRSTYSACRNRMQTAISNLSSIRNSLEVVEAKLEPALGDAKPNEHYQFERLGYFTLDPDSHA